MIEIVLLVGILGTLGAILTVVKNGFNEVINGLESLDERMSAGSAPSQG